MTLETGLAPIASQETQDAPQELRVPGPFTTIGQRLEHVVATRPDAQALVAPGRSLTYAEFWEATTDRARALVAAYGDEGGRPVALTVDSEPDSVVAIFAGILAGRPVIALDPVVPAQRVDTILASSGARLLSTDELRALPAADAVLPTAEPDDVAMIIYTSGSTGTPKGVLHPHRTWLNQVHSLREVSDLRPDDRASAILPLSYGGGLDDLFRSLLVGSATLLFDPRQRGVARLVDWLDDERVTTLFATPSLLRAVLDALPPGGRLPGSLRVVASLGEAIHSSLVARLREAAPEATYVQLSGASEIGVLAHYTLPPGAPLPSGILPVGWAQPNKRIDIVDEEGEPVPAGTTGYVVVRSAYNSDGYHRDPAATAARFTRHEDGSTSYRGGDLGRIDADGALHLMGRADAAAKVGGYLVEPAEIESVLLDAPQIREATVLVETRGPEGGVVRPRLVAYVVPAVTEKPVTPAAVRRLVRDRLPSWMVPSDVVLLRELPRNDRGKVDRPALPVGAGAEPPTPAETPTERTLAAIWCSVLQLADVSVDADFWELGADSLSVEELLTTIRQTQGTTISSTELAQAPTIRELAALLDLRDGGTRVLPPTAVQLRDGAGHPPVFAFAGGGAAALSLHPIAAALRSDVPVHGFHAAGYEARGLPDWSIPQVVRRHLKVIRTVSPQGPYVLVGHSFGGLLALETAARLAREGAEVPLVVLLDTILPDRLAASGRASYGGPDDRPAASPIPPLAERLRMHCRLLGAGLIRYRGKTRDDVFWEQSHRMVNRHRLTTWAGRTLLFTADDNPDRPVWWRQVLTGPHEVIQVDGGHSSILRPPFEGPIVARLDEELARLVPTVLQHVPEGSPR